MCAKPANCEPEHECTLKLISRTPDARQIMFLLQCKTHCFFDGAPVVDFCASLMFDSWHFNTWQDTGLMHTSHLSSLIHTCPLARTHTYIHTHKYKHTHTHTHTCAQTHTRTYTHTNEHTHTHTHTHAHTHTHTGQVYRLITGHNLFHRVVMSRFFEHTHIDGNYESHVGWEGGRQWERMKLCLCVQSGMWGSDSNMYTQVCIYVCICIFVHVYTCANIWIHTPNSYMHAQTHIRMHICRKSAHVSGIALCVKRHHNGYGNLWVGDYWSKIGFHHDMWLRQMAKYALRIRVFVLARLFKQNVSKE